MAMEIGRRGLIAGLGGVILTGPPGVRAQQPALPVIGFLGGSSAADRAPFLAVFRAGLSESGYVDGRDVTIEYRFADGQYDRMPSLAAELVRRPVNVIFAGDLPATLAAKAATSSIPIVFNSGGDVVQLGLVASLNRPGANVTGVNMIAGPLSSKQFDLLHELVPGAKIIGFLANPQNANADADSATVQEAARALGARLIILEASTDDDFEKVFARIAQEKVGALLVNADVFFTSERDRLVKMAARNAIPTIYAWREFCLAGGLISYGPSIAASYHECGLYVGRILKGAKPSEVPVIQPTKFELVINLKTAKALGLAVPHDLLALADEVIE